MTELDKSVSQESCCLLFEVPDTTERRGWKTADGVGLPVYIMHFNSNFCLSTSRRSLAQLNGSELLEDQSM
jgi:hypothetical protein